MSRLLDRRLLDWQSRRATIRKIMWAATHRAGLHSSPAKNGKHRTAEDKPPKEVTYPTHEWCDQIIS
eukprot:CAMPEP_0177523208 /NCGR_PEP_ID=MMETSP0369-20130122/49252_1 /TAXON_ID=447022 ORGANISM="Scrippsiella hangoei-like, Strain SHHI-4" /NCGR_SAMPLE_ID=MMETSP0369 /ASSEMBLY_ACC=CAM_ASM_000364 /LENGTH=66 /DNA_ID=CAMNT_0019002999 /DNA_START=98 /DNA_END=295 /DNA_ORIENTATION=-